jgi:hypothetical protein
VPPNGADHRIDPVNESSGQRRFEVIASFAIRDYATIDADFEAIEELFQHEGIIVSFGGLTGSYDLYVMEGDPMVARAVIQKHADTFRRLTARMLLVASDGTTSKFHGW